MKSKFIIILFLVLLLCGCEVQYNLNIDEQGNVYEEFTILQPNSFYGNTNEEIKEQLDWFIILNGDEVVPANYYNRSIIKGNSKSGLKYEYDFSSQEYKDSLDVLRNCFENYSFSLDEEVFQIYADNFICTDYIVDNGTVSVNINIDGNLIDGNFDKNEESKYTWRFNGSNPKNIFLKINRKEPVEEKSNNLLFFSIIAITIVLVLSASIFILFRYRQNNKI